LLPLAIISPFVVHFAARRAGGFIVRWSYVH